MKIIRKGNTPQEGTSTFEPSDSGNFHNIPSKTPITFSISPIIPYVGFSKTLNFGSFPDDFCYPGLILEGEIFDTPVSLKLYCVLDPRS